MITIPGRIPITIHPLFWLVAFFVGWVSAPDISGALLCILVVLVSVLIHEFGHALTAGLFGQKTRIELAAFGGFTYREGRKLKLWEEFLVVLNGPIAGFLVTIGAYALYLAAPFENPLLAFVVRFSFIANLFWTVINLMPVLPLDGGHLMSIILEAIFGFRGVKIAILVGIGVAVFICTLFFAIGQFVMGALFLILTFESFRSLRYYKMFNEKDRDAGLQQLLQSADIDFEKGDQAAALKKLESVRSHTKEGILFSMATQEIAEIYRSQGKYVEAYQLLLPIQKNLTGEGLALFQFLAHQNCDFKTVLALSNKCFQENPTYDTALINALACGALKQAESAVGWLECALREGLPSLSDALKRLEFNSIRQHPRFAALLKTPTSSESDHS